MSLRRNHAMLCCAALRRMCFYMQVMLHTSAPFQAGDLQAQQEELSKKLEAKKAEETRSGLLVCGGGVGCMGGVFKGSGRGLLFSACELLALQTSNPNLQISV
jgi:hypothetical protein